MFCESLTYKMFVGLLKPTENNPALRPKMNFREDNKGN